jgi:hypothetical protein
MNKPSEMQQWFDNLYPGNSMRHPERPVNPPDEIPVTLDEAEQRLRAELKQTNNSIYWDDFVQMMFEEITDEEADKVARMVTIDPLVAGCIMRDVRGRTITKFAERFMTELCS